MGVHKLAKVNWLFVLFLTKSTGCIFSLLLRNLVAARDRFLCAGKVDLLVDGTVVKTREQPAEHLLINY